jgi:regulator of cell morphogenesis and NO signaling
MKIETLANFYANDHHRLDGLFAAFQDLKGKDRTNAKVTFRAFRSGIEQHMAWEEAVLFPEYEDRVNNPEDAATEELRTEHSQIQDQLDVIEEKLKNNNFETTRALCGCLSLSHYL